MPITVTMLALAMHIARRRGVQVAHARQAELEAANAQLHLAQVAMDCAGDSVLWIANDGTVTYANQAAAHLLGRTAHEIVGMPIAEIDVGRSAQSRTAGEANGNTAETTYRSKDGELYPVEVRSQRVEVEGQGFFCAIARNLTQRRRIEETLRRAQRLESLGVLAGGLAHDFNNLLVGMIGNADLAREMVGEGSPARHLLDQVLEAGDRSTLLTTQLLAYAGGSVTDKQKLDLDAEIDEIAHLLASSLPKGVRLEIDLPADLPAVNADRAQLQQMVMDFVVNAGEALGGADGTVRLRTLKRDFSGEEASRLEPAMHRPAGQYVGFEVRDDGCGMDDATQAMIFDPFFTTKARGRGLGLAAVLGITRRHAGGIKIDSTEGDGTTFSVFLPSAGAPGDRTTRPPAIPLRESGLALVVDDEPAVRGVARQCLESFGFDVIEAQDGVLGVEAVRDRKDELRLVLLDITLPRMSGREALRVIQMIQPALPVVLSSGYEDSPEALPRSENARVGFLKKPYRRDDLARAVREALRPGDS